MTAELPSLSMAGRASERWSTPEAVAGFAGSPPNSVLLELARTERRRVPSGTLLDIGCGAGRNAVPLAEMGWRVIGVDLALPMLAGVRRRCSAGLRDPLLLAQSRMDALPVATGAFDLLVAHGIWNLARSGAEMRRGMAEAARAAAPGAALFVFTFSRQTLPPEARPIPGERFVFTEFAGEPQCFLTANELLEELHRHGFVPDPAVPLRELNRRPVQLHGGRPPVIHQGAFRFAA
jgi:SAM-dependent methyltransferase